MSRVSVSAMVAVLLSLLGVGCGESVSTGGGAATPQLRSADLAGAAAAAGDPVDEYFYNPAGKRDPFLGFFNRKDPISTAIDINTPPLQRWDVDKYVLTGIIWNTQSPRALLVDPEGTGHSVRLGTYVGRNWGKVTAITETGVVVTEEYQTLDGELVVNPVSMGFSAGNMK